MPMSSTGGFYLDGMGSGQSESYETNVPKTIEVSDDFFDCYVNFNVSTQVDKMKTLSRKELYLLLVLCFDKHDHKDPTVRHNFKAFKEELEEIYDLQDGKTTVNPDIIAIQKETEDDEISTVLLTKNGVYLPPPKEKSEVRDIKIEALTKDDDLDIKIITGISTTQQMSKAQEILETQVIPREKAFQEKKKI